MQLNLTQFFGNAFDKNLTRASLLIVFAFIEALRLNSLIVSERSAFLAIDFEITNFVANLFILIDRSASDFHEALMKLF